MASQPGYEIGYDDRKGRAGLTARERDVLGRVEAGESQAQIARDLELSRGRVSAIVKQLRAKGVRLRIPEPDTN